MSEETRGLLRTQAPSVMRAARARMKQRGLLAIALFGAALFVPTPYDWYAGSLGLVALGLLVVAWRPLIEDREVRAHKAPGPIVNPGAVVIPQLGMVLSIIGVAVLGRGVYLTATGELEAEAGSEFTPESAYQVVLDHARREKPFALHDDGLVDSFRDATRPNPGDEAGGWVRRDVEKLHSLLYLAGEVRRLREEGEDPYMIETMVGQADLESVPTITRLLEERRFGEAKAVLKKAVPLDW